MTEPAKGATEGHDTPILWHVPLSRSMRVLWLLEEIGCPYELRELSFLDGSMRKEPYAAIHPVGRSPAMQIGDITFHESGAMVEWLCETRAPELWRAPGEEGRIGWLDWLHFAETLAQHIANLTQHHIMLREDWQRSPTVMKLEAARLSRALGLVEKAVESQDWLMGAGFSGVDCAVGWSVWTARRFVRFEERPALAAYAERCAARPAFGRSLPPEDVPVLYSREFYEVPDV
ncbi:glutathione S-transferase family protein [Paracoccus sp. Z118]|uniref:glutathione S-transferase family protein n=1 Tax=Paracoccus sp. Z118 TaxID=2851017 RepID=UPI001C2C44D4|nr:glutathione S-transferase family protein [Paracoccus sp. Z118]MBV0892279.1 glutathione S-transferase family protein [Paracoccus sp. Z118]